MRRFNNYRDIRKRALIYGLPLMLFVLQMIVIVGSLLVIIFSFSLPVIVSAVVLNLVLYYSLLKLAVRPNLLKLGRNLPQHISNKRNSGVRYED